MFKSKGIKGIKNKSLSSSQQLVLGSFLILLGIILGLSIVSYFFTGESDQSTLNDFTNRSTTTENWLSKSGAWISHFLVFKGFGVASIILASLLSLSGVSVLAGTSKTKLYQHWFWGTLIAIWISVAFGFAIQQFPNLGGTKR